MRKPETPNFDGLLLSTTRLGIIAALIVGALGGTISMKTPTAIAQMTARPGFIKPAVLAAHQIIPNRIPMCIPDRLTKCSSPVLRKAR